jgi:predicted  nucleic acid-binding Zn-ribbon protein
MPHQCVRCNTFYEDLTADLLKGCKCGGKLFFYIKPESLGKAKQMVVSLTDSDKTQIEQDVLDIVGKSASDEPVVLDLESIRVVKPGKYEIDLVQLFKGDPVIYKLDEGKYIIDIIKSFAQGKNKKV